MIIALSGYGGAGKDSVADVLVEHRGFKRYAWADTLRMAAAALDPIVHADEHGAIYRYNEVVEEVGYNVAKFQFPEVRVLLQRLGTEVGRDLISDTVWVDATLARIERDHLRRIEEDGYDSGDIVITDTRFKNEANAVHAMPGDAYVVRVTRPAVGPAGDHPSETDLDDWPFDYTIDNCGYLSDLEWAVADMLKSLENRD